MMIPKVDVDICGNPKMIAASTKCWYAEQCWFRHICRFSPHHSLSFVGEKKKLKLYSQNVWNDKKKWKQIFIDSLTKKVDWIASVIYVRPIRSIISRTNDSRLHQRLDATIMIITTFSFIFKIGRLNAVLLWIFLRFCCGWKQKQNNKFSYKLCGLHHTWTWTRRNARRKNNVKRNSIQIKNSGKRVQALSTWHTIHAIHGIDEWKY